MGIVLDGLIWDLVKDQAEFNCNSIKRMKDNDLSSICLLMSGYYGIAS